MSGKPIVVSETDVDDITTRFTELGLKPSSGICILPSNFLDATSQDELFCRADANDLKILFRQAKVTLDKIEPDGVKIPFRDDRDSSLYLPALLLGSAFLANNPHLLNIALAVVANYVTDYFRGKAGKNRVTCSVIVEKTDNKTTKQINYDGPPEEFGKLIDSINKAIK
jgi:hypothetical protein